MRQMKGRFGNSISGEGRGASVNLQFETSLIKLMSKNLNVPLDGRIFDDYN